MQVKVLAIVLLGGLCCAGATTRADDAYAAAARLYSSGDYSAAAEAFTRLLQTQPPHPQASEARFYLAEATLQLDDLQTARDRYADFLQATPEHPLARHALVHYGEACLLLGDAAAAKPAFEEFLKKFPQDDLALPARLRLAQALEALGDLNGALKHFSSLIPGDTAQSWPARLGAGRVLYRAGRHADASRTLTAATWPEEAEVMSEAAYWTALAWMAQGKPREAVDLIDQILERHPKLSGADMLEYAAGLAWQQAEDRAAAAERFERVSRDFPASRWAEVALKFRVQLAFETGDYEQARALADTFLATYAHSPHRALVLQYRGRTDTRLRRYQSAEATFRELLKSAPASQTAGSKGPAPATHQFYLAEAQVARGAYAAGLETLAAARRSGLPAELAADAVACEAAGMIGLKYPEQAIAVLSLWLKSNGKQPTARVCRAQLALAQAAAGKWQAALAGLDEWYRTDPSEPQSLLSLNSVGELAYRQGRFAEALKCYDRLSAADVPDAYRIDGLAGAALTRFAMGNHARSATSWEQLLREFPSHPLAAEASLRRAKALEAAGDMAAALAGYRQTATKFPHTREAPEALAAAARLAVRGNSLSEAVECYRELVDGFADYPQRDAALAQWAALLDGEKQTEAADEIWLRLEQDYPDSRYAQEAIARSAEVAVKRHAQNAADLVARLEANAKEDADRRRVVYLQGKLAAQAEDWPRVETLMQQIVEASTAPEYRLEAAYWLAEAAFRQERWDVAQQRFELLAADRGSRDDAWLTRVPLRQAQILLHQGEYAAARQALAGLLAQMADDDSPAQAAAKELLTNIETAERQATGEETRTAAESGPTLR